MGSSNGSGESTPASASAQNALGDAFTGSGGIVPVLSGEHDEARFTPITLGIAGEEDFEVLEGLEVGATVVTGPYRILRDLGEGDAVKRGIWAAGGFPLEFPTISMCEVFHDISTLIYRNLMAMSTEEMIASTPIHGVVLLSTCDKDVPAQAMALATVNKPAIIVTGGTRLAGFYEGETVACSTDTQRFMWEYKAGTIGEAEMREVEDCGFYNTCGACGVMGTANSVQSMAEAMGLTLPGCASIPAVYAQRIHMAEATGVQIVELVQKDIRPSDILTRAAIENAIKVLMGTGASTNLVIHLIAIARRAGVHLTLDDFDRISKETPFITDVKPCGGCTVEELYHAGGIVAVMKELEPLLDTSVMTASGQTMRENLQGVKVRDPRIIHSLDNPIQPDGGLRIVRGSLAPDGAVIKTAAASPHLLKHTGPAAVIRHERGPDGRVQGATQEQIDRDFSEITTDHVIVGRYQGPIGAPGMPAVYMFIATTMSLEGLSRPRPGMVVTLIAVVINSPDTVGPTDSTDENGTCRPGSTAARVPVRSITGMLRPRATAMTFWWRSAYR